MKENIALKNKSLMTLYGDYLAILNHAVALVCLNTFNEHLKKTDVQLSEANNEVITWTRRRKEEINNFLEELRHYREYLMNNPCVLQGLGLERLVRYKQNAITGIKGMRKNANYATPENRVVINETTDLLVFACNSLLELIRDRLKNTDFGKQEYFFEICNLIP